MATRANPFTPGAQYVRPNPETKILTARPNVRFLSQAVQPPSRVYIAPEDDLFIVVNTQATPPGFTVSGRLLLYDGTIAPFLSTFKFPNTDGSGFYHVDLAEGFLLSLVLESNIKVPSGVIMYMVVGIQRGRVVAQGTPYDILISGPLQEWTPLVWPQGQIVSSLDGRGVTRHYSTAAPAAGAEISIAVPNELRWQLIGFKGTLTTSGVAGNRNPILRFAGGAANPIDIAAVQTLGPGVAGAWNWVVGGQPAGPVLGEYTSFLPDGLLLDDGFTIKTLTAGLDAGDQWAAPSFIVQEWLAPG